MQFISVLITVEEIARSRHFYQTILGQKIKFDFGENVLFENGIAIHLKNHFKSIPGLESYEVLPGMKNIELYFEDEKIQEVEATLKKSGISFIHKIQEQPWRQRVMRILDPDGYIVEIGESMPSLVMRLHQDGLDIKSIHDATGLPELFIHQTLGGD